MFGRGKKPVSLAYKEKLLSDIAYYEKRIEEALHKRPHNTSEDALSSDEDSNPYKLTVGPRPMQLKREEARLCNCASMTLELAMLTIMQSEVNVMAVAPEVRRAVNEDGTWLEVAAECKIDLVSFTITFYAHKPHRKFAPTRFRNLQVSLTKLAHEKELSQSVIAKLNRPNLALQVLQSYATAFRSRRTTLLELAEKYADRLNMEAMPEGGYRVKFLSLLTVEWTLENMWSPVVPFCHRMKFEVEYMPKHYIHAIGKLYKQFKDPSLETSERTDVLSKIFDICLEAQGPARDLQDTFESDPETAGRLHERRTTIDQEMEVPSKCDQNIQLSPQKQPKGKENKAHNRKTTMAPPKTIPKKAKKVANVNNKAKEAVNNGDRSKSTKTNENGDMTEANNDKNANETRKAVKRAIENDEAVNAKKIRIDEKSAAKSTDKITENDDASEVPNVSSKSNARKKDSKAITKDMRDLDDVDSKTKKYKSTGKSDAKNLNKRNEINSNNAAKKVGGDDIDEVNSKNKKNEGADKSDAKNLNKRNEINSNNAAKKVGGDDIDEVNSKNKESEGADKSDAKNLNKGNEITSKNAARKVGDKKKLKPKEIETNVATSKNKPKELCDAGSVTTSKTAVNKIDANDNKNVAKSKKQSTESSVASSKNSKKGVDGKSVVNSKTDTDKNSIKGIDSNDLNKKVNNDKEAHSKNLIDTTSSASSKNKNTVKKDLKKHEKTKPTEVADKNKDNNEKKVHKKTVDDNQVAKSNEIHKMTEKNVKTKENTDTGASKSNDKNKKPLHDKVTNKVTKHKEIVEITEKSVKTKESNTVASKSNDKIKKSLQDAVRNKASNTKTIEDKSNQNAKTVENNTQRINKNKEFIGQKMIKPNSEATNNKNDTNNKKAGTFLEKIKTVSKVSNVQDNNKNETTSNPNKNVGKVENKVIAKVSTNNKISQKNTADKLLNIKAKIVPEMTKSNVVKSNVRTENPNLRKIKENQSKIVEKLKTRIPMMKHKLKIGTFNDNFRKGEGKTQKNVEKTKIPLKSLPVFKKIVRNPTRISPRKLPSALKPSSQGYSNK